MGAHRLGMVVAPSPPPPSQSQSEVRPPLSLRCATSLRNVRRHWFSISYLLSLRTHLAASLRPTDLLAERPLVATAEGQMGERDLAAQGDVGHGEARGVLIMGGAEERHVRAVAEVWRERLRPKKADRLGA